MDRFDFYQEHKQNMQEVYEQKRQLNLPGEDQDYYKEEGSALKEKYNERIEKSDYADRTQYYFKDAQLTEAKVARYKALGNDQGGVVTNYATDHGYKSARKRKKSSNKAADALQKAADLQKRFNEEGKTPLEIYKHREKVMRLRMEAKEHTALVKATSKDDYEYRVAKSNLSGLMMLKDQLDHLELKQADKEKYSRKLENEIAEAEEKLNNTKFSSETKWRNIHGFNDKNKMAAKLTSYKNQLDADVNRNQFKNEDAALFAPLELLGKESTRQERLTAFENCKANNVYHDLQDGDMDRVINCPCYTVLRDQNGNPINAAEKKKDDWNAKWLEAVSNPEMTRERKRLIRQAMKRYEKVEIPTPAQLRQKGVMYFYKKDPIGFYELMSFSTRLNGLQDYDSYADTYVKNNKVLRQKIDAAAVLSALFQKELKKHLIQQTANGYELNKTMTKQDVMEGMGAEEANEQLNSYEQLYNLYSGTKNAEEELLADNIRVNKQRRLSFEDAKKFNPNITEEGYRLISKLWPTNALLRDVKLQGAMKRTDFKMGGEAVNDITRLNALLKQVNYDKNGDPATLEDEEKHEWNMRMVNTFEHNDSVTRNQMIQEDFIRYYEEFQLPTVEQLQNHWIEDTINTNPEALSQFCRMTLAYSGVKKISNEVANYVANNQALSKKLDVMTILSQTITYYLIANYGFSNKLGTDADFQGQSAQQQNVALVPIFMGQYGDQLNEYNALNNQAANN